MTVSSQEPPSQELPAEKLPTDGPAEPPADVLVVGAGPTGLTLALTAHALGARVRVVERRSTAFRPSRALITHPRTLEVLRPLGVVDALLDRADTSPAARVHLGSRVVPVRLGNFALPDTPYPHLSLLRQADVEEVLGQALAERGVPVERGTELAGFVSAPGDDPIQVVLRSRQGTREARYPVVVGCDGAHSAVRTASGIGWRGGGYRQDVVLADVELDGDLAPGVAHIVAGRAGLLFLFGLGERAGWRLLATRPAPQPSSGAPPVPYGQSGPPLASADLQRLIDDAGLAVRVAEVAWSTQIRVQHRIATRYRRAGRFLAGDAAHVHSPAAAQGMNTGIQDAVNLGWKLAFASSSVDRDRLLDSYQDERRPVARLVLAMTHLVFWAESAGDPVASTLRGWLAPLAAPLVPWVLGRRRVVAEGIRVLSGLRFGYRASALSVSGSPVKGWVRPGDRLPDAPVVVDDRWVRLHELTARPGVHVLTPADAPRLPVAGEYVRQHWLSRAPGPGVVAVRPDGYVGYRGQAVDQGLMTWLARVGALPATLPRSAGGT